jgi:cytochrome c553
MTIIPQNQRYKPPPCTTIRSALVWPIALVAFVFATTGLAEDVRKNAIPDREVQAKLQYCKVCHGVSAQGFRGFYPIPRLAGQQPTYLENQLQAFIEHRRTNNVMFNVAHSLSPSMITALAANFNALNPPPLGGAPGQLAATGGKIFQDGLPDQDIAACAACHGPDGQAPAQFLVWQVSFIPTSSTNCSIGAKNAVKIQKSRTHRQS